MQFRNVFGVPAFLSTFFKNSESYKSLNTEIACDQVVCLESRKTVWHPFLPENEYNSQSRIIFSSGQKGLASNASWKLRLLWSRSIFARKRVDPSDILSRCYNNPEPVSLICVYSTCEGNLRGGLVTLRKSHLQQLASRFGQSLRSSSSVSVWRLEPEA